MSGYIGTAPRQVRTSSVLAVPWAVWPVGLLLTLAYAVADL
jgi:hypothetical protein